MDLGDLTTGIEYDLMCPNNPIGTADMYFVSNHGSNNASTPEFINGIQPRVAIFQNGPRKGAAVETFRTLYSSPRLENIWQLHWSYGAGIEYNTPGIFIANIGDPASIANAVNPAPRIASTAPTMPQQQGRRPDQQGGAMAHSGHGFGGKAAAHTPAYWIEITVQPDGAFTVLNTRNGYSKTYEPAHR